MNQYKNITAKNYDELLPYLKDWEGLIYLKKLPISYSPNWLCAWLKSYSDESIEIDVTFVYSNEILIAVIPLMLRIEGKKRTLKFLSDSCSDYLGFPFSSIAPKDLSDIVLNQFKSLNFTHFNFNNVHEDDLSLPILISALTNCGLKTEIKTTEKSLSFKLDRSYQEKFTSIISHRQFRRKERDIKELGSISFKIIHSADRETLEEIFELHIKKWSHNKVFPQFADDRRKEFVRLISDLFSNNNQFTIFCLYAEGILIAYRLGIISQGVYHDWNTSFDSKHQNYAPGTVLLIKVIQYLLKENLLVYDFLNGNEKYKYIWATRVANVFKIEGENILIHENTVEVVDTPKLKNIKSKKCLILDIHGIIFKGGKPIISTIKGIKTLQSLGIKIGILTNTSAVSVSSFQKMFTKVGLSIKEEYIMTSAVAIMNYLIENRITDCYLIGGEPELPTLLKSNKIKLTQKAKEAKAVVIGFSKEFDYSRLTDAYEAIQNGAELICSDADMLYASENRNLPGTGWIVSSISSVCSKQPLVVGKPNDYALKLLMRTMEVQESETMFVGDSLESDINTGKKAGIATCLHLGGVSQLEEVKMLPSSLRPDFVVSSFDEIIEAYRIK